MLPARPCLCPWGARLCGGLRPAPSPLAPQPQATRLPMFMCAQKCSWDQLCIGRAERALSQGGQLSTSLAGHPSPCSPPWYPPWGGALSHPANGPQGTTSWSGSSRSTASRRRVSVSAAGQPGLLSCSAAPTPAPPRVAAPRQPHREARLHLPPQRPPQPHATGGRVALPLPGTCPVRGQRGRHSSLSAAAQPGPSPPPQTPYFWTSTKWPATELDYGRCQPAAATATTGCGPFPAPLRWLHSLCSHLPGKEEHPQAGRPD